MKYQQWKYKTAWTSMQSMIICNKLQTRLEVEYAK